MLPLLADWRPIAAALVVVVGACTLPNPEVRFPEITFGHVESIQLDVAGVEFVDRYAPPNAPPNVEHLFPVTPSAVARRWAADRLMAVGVTRLARVVLVNATVTETALQPSQGIKGLITTEQGERYDATIEVRIEIVDDRGAVEGQVRVVAERSRTVPENITLNQREQVWFELTEDVMRDLDSELQRTILRYLARYVR